jgi:GT2 family glycosyltransferase
VLRQDNRGLGAAREVGWRSNPAPLIAFLDDDAVAPRNWLEKLLQIFAQVGPSIACVGGPVEGEWEAPRPPWLDADLARWLTVWTLGANPVTSRDDMLFAGANMTIRRQALEAVGGFDQTLGRKGLTLLSHEESELWQRLRLAGWQSHFAPDLPVRHFVPAARLRPSWFRRRLFWEGISVARRETNTAESHRWWRAAKLSMRALVSHQVRSHLLHPRQWGRSIHWQCHVAFKLGYARGMLNR